MGVQVPFSCRDRRRGIYSIVAKPSRPRRSRNPHRRAVSPSRSFHLFALAPTLPLLHRSARPPARPLPPPHHVEHTSTHLSRSAVLVRYPPVSFDAGAPIGSDERMRLRKTLMPKADANIPLLLYIGRQTDPCLTHRSSDWVCGVTRAACFVSCTPSHSSWLGSAIALQPHLVVQLTLRLAAVMVFRVQMVGRKAAASSASHTPARVCSRNHRRRAP
jgi:hypothetical protein